MSEPDRACRSRLILTLVKSELTSSKAYFPVPQFLSSPQSIYDPGWLPYRIASYVVGKPLWWALQQLNIVSDDSGGHAGDAQSWARVKADYVVLSLLECAADGVLQKQQEKLGASESESLFNFETFKKEFASTALEGVTLSDNDLRVLLRFLERDRQAIIMQRGVSISSCSPGSNTNIRNRLSSSSSRGRLLRSLPSMLACSN